jgi:hypothetical protein
MYFYLLFTFSFIFGMFALKFWNYTQPSEQRRVFWYCATKNARRSTGKLDGRGIHYYVDTQHV